MKTLATGRLTSIKILAGSQTVHLSLLNDPKPYIIDGGFELDGKFAFLTDVVNALTQHQFIDAEVIFVPDRVPPTRQGDTTMVKLTTIFDTAGNVNPAPPIIDKPDLGNDLPT